MKTIIVISALLLIGCMSNNKEKEQIKFESVNYDSNKAIVFVRPNLFYTY